MRLGMKSAAGALLLVLAMAPAAQAQPDWWNGRDRFTPQAPAVEQSGHREWAWQGGNALSYGGPGKLRYEPGGTPRIIVTGDPAIVDTIEVDGGDIRRRNTQGFFNFSPRDANVEILVRGVTLDHFRLSGSATMELGRLQRDTLDLQVNGSGAINVQGQAKRLKLQVNGSGSSNLGQMNAGDADIAVNGSGSVNAQGQADHLTLQVNGAGNARLDQFNAGDAKIGINGSGNANVGDIGKHVGITVTGSGDAILGKVDTITATLTGSGTVRVASQPRSGTYASTGSGRVLLVGPDGKTTELAGPQKRNEERAQRERDRAQARAEREHDRQEAQRERERQRAIDRAERERERQRDRD